MIEIDQPITTQFTGRRSAVRNFNRYTQQRERDYEKNTSFCRQ